LEQCSSGPFFHILPIDGGYCRSAIVEKLNSYAHRVPAPAPGKYFDEAPVPTLVYTLQQVNLKTKESCNKGWDLFDIDCCVLQTRTSTRQVASLAAAAP
jgi:hypothetical protein